MKPLYTICDANESKLHVDEWDPQVARFVITRLMSPMTNMGTKQKHFKVETAGEDQFHLNRRQRTEGSDWESQVNGHSALAEVYNYWANFVPKEKDILINLYNVGDTAVVSSDVTDDSLQIHYSEGNIGFKIHGIAQDGCSRTSSRDGVLIQNWKA